MDVKPGTKLPTGRVYIDPKGEAVAGGLIRAGGLATRKPTSCMASAGTAHRGCDRQIASAWRLATGSARGGRAVARRCYWLVLVAPLRWRRSASKSKLIAACRLAWAG